MRTIATAEEVVLTNVARRDLCRVSIQDSDGTWQNMMTKEGFDFGESISINASNDQPVVTASINLRREIFNFSTSPLMQSSKLNLNAAGSYSALVTIGRNIKVETATIAEGTEPVSGDWKNVFQGKIDRIDFGGESSIVSLICRDKGGDLQDIFIKEIRAYAQGARVNLLTDNQASWETDTTGATAVASTITQDATQYWNGTNSLKSHTNNSGASEGFYTANTTVTESLSYTASVYLYGSGTVQLRLNERTDADANVGSTTSAAITLSSTWTRYSVTRAFGATGKRARIYVETDVQQHIDFYTDGVQLEQASAQTAWTLPSTPVYDLSDDVMQEILDDNDTGITLTVPTASEWALKPYNQQREPILTALSNISMQIAWDCRYKWCNTHSAWELTYSSPDREITSADRTFSADLYFTPQQISLDIARIRNVVRINYVDADSNELTFAEYPENGTATAGGAATLTDSGKSWTTNEWAGYELWIVYGTGAGQHQTVASNTGTIITVDTGWVAGGGVVPDTTSKYAIVDANDSAQSLIDYSISGISRYMELSEAKSSQIDTAAEAYTMARGIYNDLSRPDAEVIIPMHLFWPVELGDYYTFSANNTYFDTDQTLAVVGYNHEIRSNQGSTIYRTTLICRGKPAVMGGRWLRYESKPGAAYKPVEAGQLQNNAVTIDSAQDEIITGYGYGEFNYHSIFDSLDGYLQSVSGTGAIAINTSGYISLTTGANITSSATLIRRIAYTFNALTWDKNRKLKGNIRFSSTTNQTAYFSMGTFSGSAVGFKAIDNILYGYATITGSDQYLIQLTTIAANTTYLLEIIFYAGNRADYYINGIFYRSVKAILPSSTTNADYIMELYVFNTAASERILYVSEFNFMQLA